uniref:HTH psq-type domain-containing protein n=1 Tax=Graphocephala atropunctata TaxID=36148 RepID=A0A1B6MS97_9HEMI
MGRTEGKLPPSEALPGIGEHSVVFHNGTGFYYICKEYASELDKRLFECVRPECRVTAGMGEGCGSPLIDVGRHSHPPDLKYREKCILLHNIRRRLCLQEIPVMEILRDALASHQADSSGYATAGSSNDPLYEEPLGEELSDQVKVEMLEPLDVCESDNSEILSELTDFEEHKDEVVLSKAEPFTSLYLPEENMMETAEHEKESNRVPVFPVCLAEGEEMCYGRRTMRRKMKREIAKKSHQVLARKKNINNRWRQVENGRAEMKKKNIDDDDIDVVELVDDDDKVVASSHINRLPTSGANSREEQRIMDRRIQVTRIRNNYTPNDLRDAVVAVRSKRYKLTAAAKRFGIPYSTLREHVEGCRIRRNKGGAIMKRIERRNYTRHDMRQAMNAVKQGYSYAEAARNFGLPRSTLADQFIRPVSESIFPTITEEKTIKEKVVSISQEGFPISKQQLLSIAVDIVNSRSAKSDSPPISDAKKLGKWLSNFLYRHPTIEKKLCKTPVTEDQLVSWLCE